MAERTIATVTREQVLAFRAHRHGLAERRPADDLLEVVRPCGVQDTPPGNADVALAARLDLSGPVAADAVADRRLVVTWSLRGAPHLLAPEDLAVFTLGAAPEAGTRASLWRQPEEALDVVEDAMVRALDGSLAKGELSGRVTRQLPPDLAPYCGSCKVHHPGESVFRAAPLLGRIVLVSTAPVVLTRARAWLGSEAEGDVTTLRTELLVRYLRCYAPTTSRHFAEWAGIAMADARRRWEAIADELVRVDGGSALASDLDDLRGAPPVQGVRLLPAKDAWLQARDRDVLFADPAHRRAVHARIGGPGLVLVDGAPAGVWRAAATGRRLAVRWRPFEPRSTPASPMPDIDSEAQRVAVARGLTEAVVVPWEEPPAAM